MGVGVGDGLGAGGWVTNVIVFGAVSFSPEAVLAPGPMVTWYWVLGARFPLVGWTDSVFADHENATVVAGVIWTAPSVDGWSMGWLKLTRIACWSRTALCWFIGLVTWTSCEKLPVDPLVRAANTTAAAMRITPTAPPAHASAAGPNAFRHHGSVLGPPMPQARFISWRRSAEPQASSRGGALP